VLAEKKVNTNIGIGVGILLQIAARVLVTQGHDLAGYAAAVAGLVLFIWGCVNYAQGKGHSGAWGLLGLLSIIGLVVLVLLPDKHKQ
jgi:hypothetical protein